MDGYEGCACVNIYLIWYSFPFELSAPVFPTMWLRSNIASVIFAHNDYSRPEFSLFFRNLVGLIIPYTVNRSSGRGSLGHSQLDCDLKWSLYMKLCRIGIKDNMRWESSRIHNQFVKISCS